MIEPKLEVPAGRAWPGHRPGRKAFGMFFDAAAKSMASMPVPAPRFQNRTLSFTEQNMKAAFRHARKLVHATDLQEAIRIQSEFLRSQFTSTEHMRNITRRDVSREGCLEGQVLEPFPFRLDRNGAPSFV
jgi:hypothetical protein